MKELTDYQTKLNKFINTSNYYGTLFHPKQCQICNMPKEDKEKVNNLILKDVGIQYVKTYLLAEYPDEFDPANVERCIRQHSKYLPYLLEEVKYKSMFKRAKRHLEECEKSTDELSNLEKIQIISKIEEEIIKEYSSFEDERMSIMNVFYKNTLPLLMTRLHNDIVSGKAKDIRDITLSSESIFNILEKMSKFKSIAQVDDSKTEKESELDLNKINENPKDNQSTKENILSLTDRIAKATEGKTG